MMFASGAIPNMTPRQTAGADGPEVGEERDDGSGHRSGRPDPDRLVRDDARGERRRCPGCRRTRRARTSPRRAATGPRRPGRTSAATSSTPRWRRSSARWVDRAPASRSPARGRPAGRPAGRCRSCRRRRPRSRARRRRRTAPGSGGRRGPRPRAPGRRPRSACRGRGGPPIGAKMSRPWNVDVITRAASDRGSRGRGRPRSRRAPAAAGISSPLSGPTRSSPRAVRIAIGRRSVPTPGSTTATWALPTGRYGTAHQSRNAPSRIAYLRTSWPMSTTCASGAMPRITPGRWRPVGRARRSRSAAR